MWATLAQMALSTLNLMLLHSPAVLEGLFFLHLPLVIRLVALSATLGATMSLSVASDLLALATLHLYCFYIMATAVFAFHIRALGSLFNIFRGACVRKQGR